MLVPVISSDNSNESLLTASISVPPATERYKNYIYKWAKIGDVIAVSAQGFSPPRNFFWRRVPLPGFMYTHRHITILFYKI